MNSIMRFRKITIASIRFLRSIGWLKEPVRKYTYKGETFPFYKAPVHATKEGALYMNKSDLFNCVKFRKIIDKAKL